jgi:6-hydroxy-3-succinoylpyridine 3-monooxygenase
MASPAKPNIAVKPGDRLIVYIDGFNLYYGALREAPRLKWLNIDKFCRNLRPNDDLQFIRFFSSMVIGPTRPNQEVYLRALETLGTVKVILGRFKNKQVKCSVVGCEHTAQKWFQIPEEKRTDVNIAVSMVDDAYQNRCDHLVLISGDSDLVPAVAVVRERFPEKKVTVYVPSRNPTRGAAVELRSVATRHRDLPLLLLERCQFEDTIPDGAGGILTKPADWR